MKKLLTSLLSAALIAMPLAVISTPASAQTQAAPAEQAPAKAKKAKKAKSKKAKKAKSAKK